MGAAWWRGEAVSFIHYLNDVVVAPRIIIRAFSKCPDFVQNNSVAPNVAGRGILAVHNCLQKQNIMLYRSFVNEWSNDTSGAVQRTGIRPPWVI